MKTTKSKAAGEEAADRREPSSLEIETRIRHRDIKTQLADAIEAQAFWEDVCGDPQFEILTRDFEDTIQRCRIELENAKSDEIKTLQADIRSRRDMLLMFEKRRNPRTVMDLRTKLREFEQANGLLLGGETGE